MLPSTAITKALLDTHTDSTNYDTTVGIEAYNIVRNRVINAIVQTKQDYFWDRVHIATNIAQSEYNISEITGTPNLAIKEVSKVFIKYSASDTYFTPVTFLDPSALDEDPDYYSTSQSKTSPFFNIRDKSIFIYPAPTESGADLLKMTIIYQPAELTLTTNDTVVDEDKQYIYSLGIAEHIFKSQGKTNEAVNAGNEFTNELNILVREMKNRYNKPIKKTFKNNLNEYR